MNPRADGSCCYLGWGKHQGVSYLGHLSPVLQPKEAPDLIHTSHISKHSLLIDAQARNQALGNQNQPPPPPPGLPSCPKAELLEAAPLPDWPFMTTPTWRDRPFMAPPQLWLLPLAVAPPPACTAGALQQQRGI